MSCVGFFGKQAHPDVEAIARRLIKLAVKAGWDVLVEPGLSLDTDAEKPLTARQVAQKSDLAVVLGGDGTMIRVVGLLDEREVPVFGINLGFLGYLTNFTEDEADGEFKKVLVGQYETESRVRLKADLLRNGDVLKSAKVINDVVVNVSGISRIIEIRAEVDGAYVTTYRADGLIVSTPTGSTAYSLSAGGPILMPGTRSLVVAPICPHTLTMRPLVIQDDSKISLQVDKMTESVLVTFDGQQAEKIEAGDRLEIERAPGRVKLVKPPRDHYQILRAKLKWGQR
jgi:NAD+ kinase